MLRSPRPWIEAGSGSVAPGRSGCVAPGRESQAGSPGVSQASAAVTSASAPMRSVGEITGANAGE